MRRAGARENAGGGGRWGENEGRRRAAASARRRGNLVRRALGSGLERSCRRFAVPPMGPVPLQKVGEADPWGRSPSSGAPALLTSRSRPRRPPAKGHTHLASRPRTANGETVAHDRAGGAGNASLRSPLRAPPGRRREILPTSSRKPRDICVRHATRATDGLRRGCARGSSANSMLPEATPGSFLLKAVAATPGSWHVCAMPRHGSELCRSQGAATKHCASMVPRGRTPKTRCQRRRTL